MEGLQRKKTIYQETLENLYQELRQARSVSSGGRRLALLGLLYDVHRVHQFFERIGDNLAESIGTHNILLYDADVDYNEWSMKLDIRFDVAAFYMPDEEEADADADSVKETLWHVFDTFSRDGLKDTPCKRTEDVQMLAGVLTGDMGDKMLVAALNESVLALRECLLQINTCLAKHKMKGGEGKALYQHEEEIFQKRYEDDVVQDFESWKDQFDDDEEVVKRHFWGKYCTEMLTLFISGFLAPRISSQAEADMSDLDKEFETLKFMNIPPGMDAKAHYSALRELFDYKNNVVVPKKESIGKYFFRHRKTVGADQRRALFRFVKMIWLIEEEKKPKAKKAELNYDGIKIAMKRMYLPKCLEAVADGYGMEWLGKYIDALMESEHRDELAKEWENERRRSIIAGRIIGSLKEAGVFKENYSKLGKMLDKKNGKTFARYISEAKKSDICAWTIKYTEGK